MRGKEVPRSIFFLVYFAVLGFSEWAKNWFQSFFIIFGLNFGFLFLGSWMFWVPFGSHPGPLEAFLRGLCSQKPLKNQWVFKVFVNEGFWFFEALDGPIGFILASLGPIWSKNGLQDGFQKFPEKRSAKC